jgi:tripartite-type tricarboxylate transporter receptor subunit TctC
MGRVSRRRNAGMGFFGFFAALFTLILPVQAQDYPTRPVKIIVPFPAGGTADVMPRLIGEWLSRKWNQPVIIENKPGAAGNIGTTEFSKADPDGYTLLSAPPPPLVINQSLYPKLNFDPASFEPIVIISRVPNSLVVHPSVTAKNVAEFIAMAKAQPGKITSATQGNGTTSHLTSEMFQMMAQVKFQHVPYRGSAPALQDLALVKAGNLRLLAVATPKRMASLPDVPTIAETLPGFDSAAWYAVVAPAKTPATIVAKINADINEALRDPAILARFVEFSAEPIGGSPAETAGYMREEVARWRKVIETAGVKLE